jgi:hypothetical protein
LLYPAELLGHGFLLESILQRKTILIIEMISLKVNAILQKH